MKPFGEAIAASIKLFGDWNLRIRFTYTIRDSDKNGDEMLPEGIVRDDPYDPESIIGKPKKGLNGT